MAVKRFVLELPIEQYEFLRQEAKSNATSVAGFIRKLIDNVRLCLPKQSRKNCLNDPFYVRKGSFDGPGDLSENHDSYLYRA